MPQDSSYIINQAGDTIHIVLRDSLSQLKADELMRQVSTHNETGQGWSGLYVIALVSAFILVPAWLQYFRSKTRNRKVNRVYDNKHAVYDNILQHFMPYYRSLSTASRERFLKRTLTFKESKRFRYVELEEEEHMSLLISATAVQLTFGLEAYLMDHFRVIYVMRTTYRYGLYNVPFEGHVNENGIYLSWQNFLNAYADYTDGDNVGLHEMAHALTYVNFTANNGVDNKFKYRFRQFSKTGRAVFGRMQMGETSFLGNYASTNYEEFWAVCVENFFERPQVFKDQLPELYTAMCNLLNQDMLATELVPEPVENI
jgi:MtfA peptidase